MGKAKTLLGQFVEVRGLVKRVAVAPQFRPAKVISQNENNVWLSSLKEGLNE